MMRSRASLVASGPDGCSKVRGNKEEKEAPILIREPKKAACTDRRKEDSSCQISNIGDSEVDTTRKSTDPAALSYYLSGTPYVTLAR